MVIKAEAIKAHFLFLNMMLNSRQTVVMMIPKTAIEYTTVTETRLKDEMTVIGVPSCGGKPSVERHQVIKKNFGNKPSFEHLLGHTVESFSPSMYASVIFSD